MSFLLFFPKAGLIRSDERKKTLDSKKPQLLGRRGEHKKKKKKVERGAQRRTFSCLSPSSVLSRECHLGFVGLSGGAEGAGEGGSCIVLAVIIATTLLLAVFFFLFVCMWLLLFFFTELEGAARCGETARWLENPTIMS
jgi:hypothetical protein